MGSSKSPVAFRHAKLANGLEIVAETSPDAYSAAYAYMVKTGARDESPEVAGVSHFLEHMVFKGTDKRTSFEVNRELDDLSSSSNAYTSEEQTVYYATTLPDDQQPIVELLTDIMRPALRQEDFDTEKKVILEEIAKYEDQPPYNAFEKCVSVFWGNHPLANSILGTVESVTALTRDQMMAYFEQRYSPGNIVLAAAGNVDFDALVKTAEQLCGKWEPKAAPRETPPFQTQLTTKVEQKSLAAQQYVIQSAMAPDARDDDRYAARLLATIVGDDSGSRLFWELIDTGEAEYAAIGCMEFQGAGLFLTSLSGVPDQTGANLAKLADILAEVQENGVTEEELEQAKNKICAHLVLQAERPSNRLFSVGGGWVQRGKYLTVREVVDRYRRVTTADITRVLANYPLNRTATFAIGPLEQLPQ